MNDPVNVGALVRRIPEAQVIPKKCPNPPKGCGREYEGYSLLGLRPGETRALYPCDECQGRWERLAKGEPDPPKEQLEVRMPARVRRDLDD